MILIRRAVVALTFLILSAAAIAGPTYTKITYIHPDGLGNPAAASDEQGNLEWRIEYYPYGAEYSNSEVRREADISFAGKAHDEDIGLSYFGGRWYDPDIGRFTGIDPMPVNAEDWRTFNRYSYGFNNPYRYLDPDGNLPIAIPIVVGISLLTDSNKANAPTHGVTASPDALDALNFIPGGGQAKTAMVAGTIIKVGIKKQLSTSEKKAIRGLKSQIKEHKQKLSNFKSNPDKFDNKGFLKNAPAERRNRIINSRVRRLQGQIDTFKKDIKSIQNGTKKVIEKRK